MEDELFIKLRQYLLDEPSFSTDEMEIILESINLKAD